MDQREYLIGKIQILLKTINQYREIEQASKLLIIVEKELRSMLIILDE